jgi:hypothetical protein
LSPIIDAERIEQNPVRVEWYQSAEIGHSAMTPQEGMVIRYTYDFAPVVDPGCGTWRAAKCA